LKRAYPKRKTLKRATYTKKLREYIKKRDEYCRVCGGAGHHVHHVIPRRRFKVYPERYTFIDVHDERNLMYVCAMCHNKIHSDESFLLAVIEIQEQRFDTLRKAS
jgi:5-methylcytosine-specific restriction endonuclease McrA